jgi:hypothetical protein
MFLRKTKNLLSKKKTKNREKEKKGINQGIINSFNINGNKY